MASMKLLYIGVCKENLERYYPSYISGEFLKDTFTDAELLDVVKLKSMAHLAFQWVYTRCSVSGI